MCPFIVFEGIDGCGKTTQAKLLHQAILGEGVLSLLVEDPGSCTLGFSIRKLLKQGQEINISPLAELFLFAASRAQLVTEIIRPALEKGTVVISDRFFYSTVAYQGYGRGVDLNLIEIINNIATQGLKPDLVIFLDIGVEEGLRRKESGIWDRFETENLTFYQKVRKGYLEMANAEVSRWFVVDAQLSVLEIQNLIWERVKVLLMKDS